MMMKMYSIIVHKFMMFTLEIDNSVFQISSILSTTGTRYFLLAIAIYELMTVSGVIRYLEYTSYPLWSLFPTIIWHC